MPNVWTVWTTSFAHQATQAAAARKSEIELRADLDVKSHEVTGVDTTYEQWNECHFGQRLQ